MTYEAVEPVSVQCRRWDIGGLTGAVSYGVTDDGLIDWIGAMGIGLPSKFAANLADGLEPLLGLLISGFIILLWRGVGPQHPEDHEEPHHEHDEVREGEDPLRALFALGLFAAAGGFLQSPCPCAP